MSSGVFGSIRPASITPSRDVDMLYFYRPTRSTEDDEFKDGYKQLNPTDCLIPCYTEDGDMIPGIYDVRLPLDKFSKKGFYTIYIRPKTCRVQISDVSVLASYPDVKGVVFNLSSSALNGITDLTGYRIDFSNGSSRVIKSCNRCEPMSVSTADGYPKSVRYNLIDSSSDLVFCTVTPSSAPSFKPNAYPYIGVPGESVNIVNTLFSPKMIEVEMVDHDADTISYMLEGDQVRDRDHGIITTYNEDKEIYHQADYYTIKSKLGTPLFDVKKDRDVLDSTQDYDNIMNKG